MLDELRISNLGVIEEATLVLSDGLNVLTGETGAGKTMVVTALQLLSGGRGDAGLVRAGADQAVVEARWVPAPPHVAAWVAADELDDDPDDVGDGAVDAPGADGDVHGVSIGGASAVELPEAVVHRRIRASGRSRVRIEGALASVGALRDTVARSVEIHAQDSHRRLLEPATQRRLLDAWAGQDHASALAEHADAHAAHREAVARRDELVETMTSRAREVDHLEREVAEIDAVGLTDADDHLQERIDELAHADELVRGFQVANDALGPEGAGDALGAAVDALRRLPTETATSSDLRSRLDEVVALAADLANDLFGAAESIDADPRELDRVQSRWASVRSLCRKYGPEPSDVLAHREQAAQRLAHLQGLERDADDIEQAVTATSERLTGTAAAVTKGRRRAAESLADAVQGHLADLALEHATFEVEVGEGPMTATGADTVTFLLAANPGQPAVGLAEAASGGERSRVALALEVTLADLTDAQVLVFDEVDAGVGGATAMKVGEKLAALARGGRQVLCVTHLAQLAAWADHHMLVDKVVADGTTRSVVTAVADDARVDELARMLGGDTTDAARAHAAELRAETMK